MTKQTPPSIFNAAARTNHAASHHNEVQVNKTPEVLPMLAAASGAHITEVTRAAERHWAAMLSTERMRVVEVVAHFFTEGGAAAHAKSAKRGWTPKGTLQLRATVERRVWLAPLGAGKWQVVALPRRNDKRFYSEER